MKKIVFYEFNISFALIFRKWKIHIYYMILYLRLNVIPIPVQIVESRGAPSSYAVLKKFHGLTWWKF